MGMPILTLTEMLDELQDKIKFLIDIKSVKAAEILCEIITRRKLENNLIISSAKLKVLKIINNCFPQIATALVYHAANTKFGLSLFTAISFLLYPFNKHYIVWKAKRGKVKFIHPSSLYVTRRMLRYLRRFGYKINVWWVNSDKKIAKMKLHEVDGIITDYPDRI
jgi:glycerophosphoryl diester phosphodiesterase